MTNSNQGNPVGSKSGGPRAGLVALLILGAGCGADSQPWNQDSQSLTFECKAWTERWTRFSATRDQLSTDQLELLSSLRTVDPVSGCLEFITECRITIVEGDGRTSLLESNQGDSSCDASRKLISFDSFNLLRASLGCGGHPHQAPPLLPNPRCFEGVFAPEVGVTTTVTLQVDDTQPERRLELDDCDQPGRAEKLTFTLFDSDGTTELGSSTPVATPTAERACAGLDHTFAHSGLFDLSITADSGFSAGVFYLRYY